MDTSDSTTEFETSDLYFGAYLRARGLVMIDMARSNPRTVVWTFAVPEGLTIKSLTTDWYAGAPLSAMEYANSVKVLKSTLSGI